MYGLKFKDDAQNKDLSNQLIIYAEEIKEEGEVKGKEKMTEEKFYQAVNNLWLNSEPDQDKEFLRCIDLNAEKNKEHLKGLLFLRPVQPDA